MNWLGKIFEAFLGRIKSIQEFPLKRVLLIICFVLGYLIFLPRRFERLPGMNTIRDKYADYIGLMFIVCLAWLLCASLSSFFSNWRQRHAYVGKDARRRIEGLSKWEQALVRQLYETDSHSQKLPLQNANVKMMLDKSIIVNANMGDAVGFECALQPWVSAFLDSNPEFVTKMPRFKKPYVITLAIWGDEDEGGTF